MKPDPWIELQVFTLWRDLVPVGDGVVLTPTGQVIARIWEDLIPGFGSFGSVDRMLQLRPGMELRWAPEHDSLFNLEHES